jgi:hypothetical protein
MLDLAQELISALESPRGVAVLQRALREVVADEVRRALVERDADRFVSQADLARYLGITPKALSMRLARGSELMALAMTVDGRRAWRKSEVDAVLSGTRCRRAAGRDEV